MTAVASQQLTYLTDAFLSLTSLFIRQLQKHLKCTILILALQSQIKPFPIEGIRYGRLSSEPVLCVLPQLYLFQHFESFLFCLCCGVCVSKSLNY